LRFVRLAALGSQSASGNSPHTEDERTTGEQHSGGLGEGQTERANAGAGARVDGDEEDDETDDATIKKTG